MDKINYYFDEYGVYSHSYPSLLAAVAPPANALWTAPPDASTVPDGHVIVVKSDKSGWDIVPDYRGKGAWNPDGQWEQIWAPGPLPEGWTEEAPPPSAEQLAEQEQIQIQAEATQIVQTALNRQAAQSLDFEAEQFATLAAAGLYDEWQADHEYAEGERFVFAGVVYEAKPQAEVAAETETETETVESGKIGSMSVKTMGVSLPTVVIPGQPGSEAVYKPLSIKTA